MKTNCERVMEWRATHLDEYKEYQRAYQRKIYKDNYQSVRAEQKNITINGRSNLNLF